MAPTTTYNKVRKQTCPTFNGQGKFYFQRGTSCGLILLGMSEKTPQ